ncbi:MAG: hypothetical protein Q8S13_04605 [Dehalococcoidia bacterium]|nr:hypothetical protein [Dehalococcoidia bacterium]
MKVTVMIGLNLRDGDGRIDALSAHARRADAVHAAVELAHEWGYGEVAWPADGDDWPSVETVVNNFNDLIAVLDFTLQEEPRKEIHGQAQEARKARATRKGTRHLVR